MGGVDVYFSEPVYIKRFEKPKLYLQAGNHHLTGKQAEQVVRTRIEIGDFGRIDHQSIVLQAVAAKLLSPSGVQHLPGLIQILQNSVLTDLSPAEISQLVCLAEKIDPQTDIAFFNIPPSKLQESRVYDEYLDYRPYVLLYDEGELRRYLASTLKPGL
jgi:anionic cell wall polymer biosynthesis LytR-Cps2A-Psr (LCP) family protein